MQGGVSNNIIASSASSNTNTNNITNNNNTTAASTSSSPIHNTNGKKLNSNTNVVDVPIRILVPTDLVGAIIGKGGQTIRQLTQKTRAKVDVYRGEPVSSTSSSSATVVQEKVITIRGQPENCINACREIYKVIMEEVESKEKPPEILLRILVHNDYIGRLIGKQGNIINTIKKETETTVTVSNMNDMNVNVERIITVKGELENMFKALEIIHNKVKSAFENDTKTYGSHAIMMNSIPPMPLTSQLAPPPPLPPPGAPPVPPYSHLLQAPPISTPAYMSTANGVGVSGGGVSAVAPSSFNSRPTTSNPNGRYTIQPQYPFVNGGAQFQNLSQFESTNNHATITNYSGYYPPPLYHHSHTHPALVSTISHSNHPHHNQHPHHHAHDPASHLVPHSANVYSNNQQHSHLSSSHGNSMAPTGSRNSATPTATSNHSSTASSKTHSNNKALIPNGHPSVSHLGANVAHLSPLAPYSDVEKVFLYIPNVAVGAIIGTKGSYIKNIIKTSEASVKIAPVSPDASKSAMERQVIIIGNPDSQWKAQYCIFEKIRQERFTTDDNVKLKVEIQVPAGIIGRVIGKSGKNVRELQRTTGATIKLSDEAFQLHKEQKQEKSKKHNEENDEGNEEIECLEEAAKKDDYVDKKETSTTDSINDKEKEDSTTGEANEASTDETGVKADTENETTTAATGDKEAQACDYVTLKIFGTFNSSQLAQRRIQALISQGSSVPAFKNSNNPRMNFNGVNNSQRPQQTKKKVHHEVKNTEGGDNQVNGDDQEEHLEETSKKDDKVNESSEELKEATIATTTTTTAITTTAVVDASS